MHVEINNRKEENKRGRRGNIMYHPATYLVQPMPGDPNILHCLLFRSITIINNSNGLPLLCYKHANFTS